ncbi:DUF6973 domain-containing protein, partial [Lutibacter sp.]
AHTGYEENEEGDLVAIWEFRGCEYPSVWYDRFDICEYTDGGDPIINDEPDSGGGSNDDLTNFLNQNVWNLQNPYDKWNELTECEKDFFSSNPQHLFTARGNKAEAERAANERFGNCITPNNTHPLYQTIGDAYRHAYFAALNIHNMGYTNAKTLGDAHECNPNTSYGEDKAMDLHNNAWGYHYGSTFSIIDEDQFFRTFMNAYNNGQIKILVECQ